jgi:inosine-uridine nucleoside N-ribohydrolase
MKIIVETDLGRDLDDYLMLCYLQSAGVEVLGLLITPGDPDQIAVGRHLCKRFEWEIPIAAANPARRKSSVTGVHHKLLKQYGDPDTDTADSAGHELLKYLLQRNPDATLIITGPPQSTGKYLQDPDAKLPNHTTIQGGFVGYAHHRPAQTLEKFEGKQNIPTFNLNGDRPSSLRIIDHPTPKQFVGKNICHTVSYGYTQHRAFKEHPNETPGGKLFRQAMQCYSHATKLLHDPTAAVCHIHPEVGTWVKGKLRSQGGGWGLDPKVDHNDSHLVDINYSLLWHCLKAGQ